MGKSSTTGARNFLTRRVRTSRTAWLGLFVVIAFLFVACGGVEPAAEDADVGTADVAASPVGKEAKETRKSGDAAPDFEITLFENENHQRGEMIRLSQFQGKPVVVNFWFPSCPPCAAEMPDFEAAFKAHKADGVEFIGIQLVGLDTVDDGQDFVREIGVTYALGADESGDIIRDYKVTGFPSTAFLDRDHNIIRKWTGFLDRAKIEELVQELLD